MLKNFLSRRKTDHLVQRFEMGQRLTAEELVERALQTRHSDTKIYENVIATLEERTASGDRSVAEAVFLRVKAECDKESAFMAGVDGRNPYYATPFSLSYHVDSRPFDLLIRLAGTDIIPALQSLHDDIPPSVEYREWYDAEHDMIREYESKTRPLLENTIQRILEKNQKMNAQG